MSDFLVGIEGLAILRRWGTDPEAIRARAEEVTQLAAGCVGPSSSAAVALEERSARDGYALYSATYDDTGCNVVVQIEEKIVGPLLDEVPPGQALDAACGTGRHAAHLVGRGHDVIGVDWTPAMLDIARAKVPTASFFLGRLEQLPLASGAIDLSVCALALTHLVDLNEAIVELGRVTRPGGRVIISDVHPFFAALGFHAFYRTVDGGRGFVRNHTHLHSTYLAAFPRAGLKVRACLEPCWEEDDLAAQAWLEPVAEAAHQALLGLLLVLVWDLHKVR